VICTDKTGTLTQNRLEVRAIFSRGQLFRIPQQPPVPDNPYLYETFRLCNNASLQGQQASGDPLEVALLQAAQRTLRHDTQSMPRLFEVPFDPERKRMTTVNQCSPASAAVLTKGAVETLI
jgi:magnesium-transporting ATPase (P-type)